jgi:hypothetical protein
MNPKIIEDRLNNRSRFLRTSWHNEGERLLKEGKFLEFADGLLRLVRQLDAITYALELIPERSLAGTFGAFGPVQSTSSRSRANRPSGRPVGSAS